MRVLTVIFTFLILLTPANAKVLFEFKGWTGKAYYKKGGRLSFCEASKTYSSGDKIIFVMWADKRLTLVYETGVRFKKARKYYSVVYVDKKPIGKGNGIGAARGSIVFSLPSTRNTFSSLYNGTFLQIRTQATNLKSYSLSGSAAALLKLKECVAQAIQRAPYASEKGLLTEADIAVPKGQLAVFLANYLNFNNHSGWRIKKTKEEFPLFFNYKNGDLGSIWGTRLADKSVLKKYKQEFLRGETSSDCKGETFTHQTPVKNTKFGKETGITVVCSTQIVSTSKSSIFILNEGVLHIISRTNLTITLPSQIQGKRPAKDEL